MSHEKVKLYYNSIRFFQTHLDLPPPPSVRQPPAPPYLLPHTPTIICSLAENAHAEGLCLCRAPDPIFKKQMENVGNDRSAAGPNYDNRNKTFVSLSDFFLFVANLLVSPYQSRAASGLHLPTKIFTRTYTG